MKDQIRDCIIVNVNGTFHLRDLRPAENVFFIIVWVNNIDVIEMLPNQECHFEETYASQDYEKSIFRDSVLNGNYLYVLSIENDKPHLFTFAFVSKGMHFR